MKRQIAITAAFLFACSFAEVAVASTATGVVKAVYFDLNVGSGNIVFFQMEVLPSNKPACADNPNVDYAFDVSTIAGKNLYSALLAAYASQREVKIGGYDGCSLGAAYGVNAENVRWIRTQ